ncbi:MAG: hypothetical protein M1817_002009 [Caeruleum heppii]|nr:MAG: hypothetical protein M1817_002009 [Caeruleum heppii]
MSSSTPDITLYTNHGCPWAQRAHIALAALGLPFKEVIIDLDTPREAWYLKINPRGLVPTLIYDTETICESGIVAHFLADLQPSLPAPLSSGPLLSSPSNTPAGALHRARVAFFADAYFSKVHASSFALLKAADEAERDKLGGEMVGLIRKELEGLVGKYVKEGGFFDGREGIGMAEVLLAPFLLRFYAFARADGPHALFPADFPDRMARECPAFDGWAKRVMAQETIRGSWDEESVVRKMAERVEGMRAKV